MPRLSVDIDLTYCRLADRDTSLSEVDQGLTAIAGGVTETIDGAVVTPRIVQGRVIRLVVSAGGTQIKIEPNLVLRGSNTLLLWLKRMHVFEQGLRVA